MRLLNEYTSGLALVDADGGGEWSYPALREAVRDMAAAMSGAGKQLVLLACRNDPSTVIAYLAALEAGNAVMLLDAAVKQDVLADMLARYRPDLVLAPRGASAAAAPFQGYVAEDAGTALHVQRREAADPTAPHPDLSVLLPTSGTTGSPRFVRLSHRAVLGNATSIVAALGISAAERAVSSLPLHYSYGLSVVNSHLMAGAAIVLTNRGPLDRAFWELVHDHACTSFAGVPYSYQLLERIGFERFELPSLCTMTQAGGRLDPQHVARFHGLMSARGGRFFVMYGQTEATARIAILPADRLPEKLGSAGQAIPGGRLEIEVDGVTVGMPGATGEIVYTGPNVMMGYATGREDLERGDELGGRLRTGDLGHLDDEGFLYVSGRTKRISKVSGYRIDLDDVEKRLVQRGPVAVVGTDERIVAFCEFGDEHALKALRLDLARSLSLHYQVIELRRIDALPRMANGKIDYSALEAAIR